MTKRTILYILANETKNAGEADYAYALGLALRGNEAEGVRQLVYKIPSEDSLIKVMGGDLTGSDKILPVNNKEYSQVPSYHAGILDVLKEDDITVIGVGHSTLPTLKNIGEILPDNKSEFAYLTHMVDNAEDVEWLGSHQAHLFTTINRKSLEELNDAAAGKVRLHQLDSVLHTNTLEACYVEYARFIDTPNGKIVQKQMSENEPIAFAVINAGFGIEDKHHPYTEGEAYSNGFALGEGLEANTMLLAVHGGPRNLKDENEFGQKTMDKYAEGYLAAQHQKGGNPVIVKEAFAFGLPYNVVKAGYLLAQAPKCVALISNAEGYGTMDGALRLIDKKKKNILTGMFAFDALYADPTGQRQANIDKYHEAGIAALTNEEGRLKVRYHIGTSEEAKQEENPAQKVIETLKLAKKDNVKPVYNFAAPSR